MLIRSRRLPTRSMGCSHPGCRAEGKGTPADWEKIIPDLQKFIAGHEGTASALNARVDLAKAFFEARRYDDAVKAGQKALALAPGGHGLRPLILYQLGFAWVDLPESWTRPPDNGLP